MRLGRFNTRAAADKRYFEGLLSPSAAAIVAAFVWFSSHFPQPGLIGLIAALMLTAFAGALMVSRFSFPRFKQFHLDRSVKFVYIPLSPLSFALFAIAPPALPPSLSPTY